MADTNIKESTFTYRGSVTPKATKYLYSEPITITCSVDRLLDESDRARESLIQTEFQARMKKLVDGQLTYLNRWMVEKDAIIIDLKAKIDALSASFPKSKAEAALQRKSLADLAKIGDEVKGLEKDYERIVSVWAANCAKQQGEIAISMALRAARVKSWNDKRFRVTAGKVVKGTLIVAGVALAIAATVATAGATGPIFLALAATGTAISGVSSLAQVGKMISENANMEKKLLATVRNDVEAVLAAFDKAKDEGSKLGKHLSEMRNLMKVRQDRIDDLDKDAQKYTRLVNSHIGHLAKLKFPVDAKLIASEKKKMEAMKAKLLGVKAKIDAANKANADAQALIDSLAALSRSTVDIQKLFGASPTSMKASMVAHATNIENVISFTNSVGVGFAGSGV